MTHAFYGSDSALPTKPFGSTGRRVTVVGLGGEGILRTYGQHRQAERVIREALAEGIGYCDSARVYAGSENYYGMVWKADPEQRKTVFQTSKSAGRDWEAALADLEISLAALGVDYLDLWQIHDVRTAEDLEMIGGPGGALEAFVQAREEGTVKAIGVTGHHDPDVLTAAVREWPVDAVLLPVNPVEGVIGGFLTRTLPEAVGKGIAVIGMKVLGASHYVLPQHGITAELLIRYALSWDLTTVIVGCSTPDHVRTLAETGRTFAPLGRGEQRELEEAFRPLAQRLAYYRGVI